MQARALESLLRLRVRRLLPPAEGREFLLAPLPHGPDEVRVRMVDEVEERRRLAILLPHEEERQERREDHRARGELQALEIHQDREALALHAVARLIVVLAADHVTV